MSIVELLYTHSISKSDALFVADDKGNEYSYKQAWHAILTIAYSLKNIYGVHSQQSVLAECNQSADFLLLDMACNLIGAIFVPIERGASIDRITDIAAETRSILFISEKTSFKSITCTSYKKLLDVLYTETTYSFPKDDSVAEILFTTGTTGKSKGIAISNRANTAIAENIKYGVDMPHNNIELIPLPLSHSHAIRCCYANILNGGTIIICDGLLNISAFLQQIKKYKVSAIDISPNAGNILMCLAKDAFINVAKNFTYIQFGTASISEDLKSTLIANLPGVHLYNFYGSTESGRSCVLDFSIYRNKKQCVGKPTVNSEIMFTDNNRLAINATAESPGLLASKGPMNMEYYLNDSALTVEISSNGFIYTNDLGYMDKDGFVYILGRSGDVITYNGIKISPEEIESIAIKYEGVKDAACVPVPDPIYGQIPKLFISLSANIEINHFRTFLSNHTDANKMPKRIEIINEIPRTYNGKIQRNKLVN